MPNSRRKISTRQKVKAAVLDQESLNKSEVWSSTLSKSLTAYINKQEKVQRVAFEVDPTNNSQYYSLYVPKPSRLLPDSALKEIAARDGLIATIINTRANQLKAFGRPLKDRFSTGYKISPKANIERTLSREDKDLLKEKSENVVNQIYTCGRLDGYKSTEYMTFPEFLFRTARDALSVGRFASDVISKMDLIEGKLKFHSFRSVDSSTIYKASGTDDKEAQSVREEGLKLLQQIKNKKIDPEKYKRNEYAWFQVIGGMPVQAFTAEELLVQDCYPTNILEFCDYPFTPIDSIISEVITHINIVTHNKLYFQSGRATRGMLVIKSEDVDDGILENIRQQFNASINSVNNSWRAPLFGIGPEDDIEWKVIETGSRDMEFQYLCDNNSRVILAAFQVSPDEIPGYGHLSKPTAAQALSESNSEYKLEAARDVGIRPFLLHFQDFINSKILPLIDKEVAEKCVFEFVGLDQDSPEKEATRLLQDSTLHMSLNQINEKVEKPIIPREVGGDIPFNTTYQQLAPLYVPFGALVEYWNGIEGASRDPNLQFYQNQFWFQWQQFLEQKKMNEHQMEIQKQQMGMQQQQAQMQSQNGPQSPDQGQGQEQPQQNDPKIDINSVQIDNVTSGINEILQTLGKSESQLTPDRHKLLIQHKLTVKKIMDVWTQESEKVKAEILKSVIKDMPDDNG